MTILEAVFLGLIQGLTEFLPVSSSGHLVLFSQLLRLENPALVFEVVVHAGTLLAVCAVYWQDVQLLFKAFFKLVQNPGQAAELVKTDPGCRLLLNLVLATLPVVVMALTFRKQIESLFQSSLVVGLMLILTGTILFFSLRVKVQSGPVKKPSALDAVLIGIGQAAAVIPGLSRSGTTISVGLLRGMEREKAARFSFLLSIPAILGALVFTLGDLAESGSVLGVGPILAGLIASAVTGYMAIRLLLSLIKRGRLVWFSYYTWFVGVLVVLLSMI